MIPASAPFSELARALHPPGRPPDGPGWNHDLIVDLLPDRGANLRPAAVLVAIVERAAGRHVVLTRRTEALRHHAGQISFPGGRIEPGDADPVAAALRESHEEIGLAAAQVRVLGYLDPFATITGFHVFPVVAAIDGEFIARRDPSEVDEVFELPMSFLMDAGNAREVEIEALGMTRTLVEFRHGDYRVWGATAAMLVNLRERLEQA